MKRTARTFLARQYRSLFTASTLMAIADFCIGIVAPVVSGHCLGVDAFAALAAVYAYRLVPDIFAMLIADGAASLYTQAVGRCDREGAARIFTLGLGASVLIGCLLTVAFLCFEGVYLDFVGVTGAVRAEALHFGRGYVWTLIPTLVVMYLFGLTYVDGGARLCFFGSIGYVIVNIAASWLFCLEWGTTGLAWSVNASLVMFLTVIAIHLRSPTCSFRLHRTFDLRPLVSMATLGFGTAIQPIAGSVLSFVLARFATMHFGRTGLAALAAVAAVESLLYFPKAAGQAALPLVSVYCGERNPIGLRRVMRFAFTDVLIEGLILSLLLVLCPWFEIRVFGLDHSKVLAVNIRIVGLFLLPAALTFLWGMYFRMVGLTRLVVVFSLCQWLVFPFALVIGCSDSFGISGLACGFLGQTTWLVLAFGGLYWFARRHGRTFPLLYLRHLEDDWRSISVGADALGAVTAAETVRKALNGRLDPSDSRRLSVPLAAEEMVNVIAEANVGRRVRAELALDLSDPARLRLIVRDDGMFFDPTDPDRKVTSLSSYTLACLLAGGCEHVNLTTAGHNRSVLVFASADASRCPPAGHCDEPSDTPEVLKR